MITSQQEQALSDATGRVAQDKRVPFLINRDDFRLYPNTRLSRKNPNYVPYDGKPDDDLPTRRAYVEGRVSQRPRIVNSMAEADAFDIGTASKDELVSFAIGEYGVMLDAAKDIRTLRKEFMSQVEALNAKAEALN
jgi:hypothetical protein